MKNKKIVILIAIIILVFIGAGTIYNKFGNSVKPASNIADKGNAEKQEQATEEKKKAPNFKVVDQNGKEVTLEDYIGKPVVINFWSSKCPPCRKEMPDFDEVYKKYKNKVNFMMIDSIGAFGETKEDGAAMVKENGFSFPVFFDVDQSAQKTYGIYSYPTTYILDKDGNLSRGQSGLLTGEVLSKALDEELTK